MSDLSNWIDIPATINVLIWFAASLPNLLLQMALTFKLTDRVDEMEEIFAKDNIAVAMAVGGKVIGLVVVIVFGIMQNDTIPHMLVSSWLGWLLMVAGYILLDKLTPRWDITALLVEGKKATGLFVGILFVALGILAGGLIA